MSELSVLPWQLSNDIRTAGSNALKKLGEGNFFSRYHPTFVCRLLKIDRTGRAECVRIRKVDNGYEKIWKREGEKPLVRQLTPKEVESVQLLCRKPAKIPKGPFDIELGNKAVYIFEWQNQGEYYCTGQNDSETLEDVRRAFVGA